MNIVFYTSGVSGAGRLVMGISIGNALLRENIKSKFTILHSSSFSQFAEDFYNIRIPPENEIELSKENFKKSVLYKKLKKLKPDILLVNHQWFTVHNFINEFNFKKIYLCDLVEDRHFTISLANEKFVFRPNDYDRVISIEPFKSSIDMEPINPMIMRNHDEILSREDALKSLNLDKNKKIAFYGFSGHPDDFSRFQNKYSYLKDEGYEIIYASAYGGDMFPIVNYYNAFDFIVCGAGYNQVWEANYFNKKAVFETTPVKFSDQSVRVKESKNFSFSENGADQLVDIMINM